MTEFKRIAVTDNRKYDEVKKLLKRNIQTLNDACNELRCLDSIFPVDSVAGVKKVSSQWLRSYIDGVVSSIAKDKRLPSDFKKEISKRWESVYNKAYTLCDTVASIAQFDKLALRKRDGVFMYDPQEVETFARDEAKVTLSDEQVKYLTLLQGLCESLNKVKAYEDARNWHNISDGINVPDGKGYSYVNMVWLLSLSTDGRGFGITPEKLVQMIGDGILCVGG